MLAMLGRGCAMFVVIAAASLATSAAAQPVADPVVERLDHYFHFPNAPETFRALTGRRDPQIMPAQVEPFWFGYSRGPDAALVDRLFPEFADRTRYHATDCRLDYPVAVLKARIAQFGDEHPYVRRWIEVQRAVFAACARAENGLPVTPAATPLPAPLATDDAALARLQADDRAYQAAALTFYRDDIPAALSAFQQIAHSASPHRPVAVYMIAAIHAGVRRYSPQPAVPSAQSVAEITAILEDPGLAAIHPQAHQLLGWVGANSADDVSRRAQVKATLEALEVPADQLAHDPQARARYAWRATTSISCIRRA